MQPQLNAEVVYELLSEMVKNTGLLGSVRNEERFKKDRELFLVAMLVEAKRRLEPAERRRFSPPNIANIIGLACSESNLEEAKKLLGREEVATK